MVRCKMGRGRAQRLLLVSSNPGDDRPFSTRSGHMRTLIGHLYSGRSRANRGAASVAQHLNWGRAQVFLTQALHQPAAATALPPNNEHPPERSPALP